jgi:hypothetical protein
MAKGQAVVKQESFEVVTNEIPDFLKQGNRGAENVGTDDVIIPRIELIQALSPVRKKSDPSYIEGAEEGMLYNNVTRTLYGNEVTVVPVYYTKQFLVWKDRKAGGGGSNGFRGAFATKELADRAIADLAEEALEVSDTAQHFVLVRNGDDWQEAVISMAKSKIKVSKRWNSLMRLTNTDSFSRAYKLSATTETNARNESYFNFNVAALGFVNKDLYERAEKLYETIRAGGVKVSNDYDGEVTESAESEY